LGLPRTCPPFGSARVDGGDPSRGEERQKIVPRLVNPVWSLTVDLSPHSLGRHGDQNGIPRRSGAPTGRRALTSHVARPAASLPWCASTRHERGRALFALIDKCLLAESYGR
jgi:hypothetical protein